MSRYDYPADVNSVLAIVNDLDLSVQVTKMEATANGSSSSTGSGSGSGGNGGSSQRRQTFLGNGPEAGGGQPDRLNTVERVSIKNVAALATIGITVSASVCMDGAR